MSTTVLTLESLLTLRQAAEVLGVSSSTLRRWAKQGDIPFVRISTRGDIRISKRALQQFVLDRLTLSHTPQP